MNSTRDEFWPKYSVAVFDCDGVILNSNTIKNNAFRKALYDEPQDKVNAFIDYHKKNGGISRYIKFKYYFDIINPATHENNEDRITDALDRYASIVQRELLNCEYIPGVIDTIKEIRAHSIPIYICSGGDEDELNEIFKQRETSYLFDKIFGSPKNKIDILKLIEKMHDLNKGIFFGDSESDYIAANKFFMDFFYIYGVSEWTNGHKHKHTKSVENFNRI